MEKDSRPGLTRRVERVYRALLRSTASDPWIGEHAAHFAARWRSRRIDVAALQRIVIRSGSAEAAFKFAQRVPGANVRKLQGVVLQGGSPDDMRTFAARVPGSDSSLLENTALVTEVMSG